MKINRKEQALREIRRVEDHARLLHQEISHEEIDKIKQRIDTINSLSISVTKELLQKDPFFWKDIQMMENSFKKLLTAIFEEKILEQKPASQEFLHSIELLKKRILSIKNM
ncbi:MAG: hypothetical protein JW769_02365 [Parachlamydiales bacterium]|nr:hypothetical protein [Parachlamydiales bacterium]